MTAPATAPATAASSGTGLTPVFVRLKLSLLRNGLRQSSGRRAAYVASAVVALLFAALQLLGLIAHQTGNPGRAVELIRKAMALTDGGAKIRDRDGGSGDGRHVDLLLVGLVTCQATGCGPSRARGTKPHAARDAWVGQTGGPSSRTAMVLPDGSLTPPYRSPEGSVIILNTDVPPASSARW